jgi:ribosomal protein L30E
MNDQERNRKIAAYVGFAIKSGGVFYGLEKLKNEGTKPRPALILTDDALSEKTKKEVAFFAAKKNIPIVRLDKLECVTKKPNVKIISVLDKGLAVRIMETASEPKDGIADINKAESEKTTE